MKSILGIDVGSVAAGFAVVDADQNILASGYEVHKGEVEAAVSRLLDSVCLANVGHIAATQSSSKVQADAFFNNEVAFIAAAKKLHPDMQCLLLVGGERFSLARFDQNGHYLGSKTNTSCAAGTGSFLDQQAARLSLGGIEELSRVACKSRGECPKIASRCAVFAKTDLIHAQQEGYSLDEISSGLCRGLAKNLVDTLFTGEDKGKRIIFCGGVAKNKAVTRDIENLIETKLVLPENGHLYGAIGSAFLLLEQLGQGEVLPEKSVKREEIFISRQAEKLHYYPPLSLKYSDYPDFGSEEQYLASHEGLPPVEVDIYQKLSSGREIEVYLGIDIGSTSTKAVLLSRQEEVLAGFYTRTAGRPVIAVQAIFRAIDEICTKKDIDFKVIQCGTTGSGRKFIGKIVGAALMLDEITAHARAACQLNPKVDTIIEIGGQDAKFTTLQNGRVTSSIMNTVCAAGTGSFIEEQAVKLGCKLQDYSKRTENVRAPMVSDRCTVFMERDMNHYLSEGYSVDEVLASALHAVRENYLLKVATEKHIGETVFFQGATAKNKALVAAFEQRLQRPVLVSRFCHLTGALGTALTLKDEGTAAGSFVGFDLYRQQVPITSEVCELCHNHCKISVAEVGGSKVAYGFLCGRDYETKNFVRIDNQAFDLLAERKKITRVPAPRLWPDSPVIGLPAAVHMADDLAMWRYFFGLLGIKTITSEKCSDGLARGKKLAQAEFCAPVMAMHGHLDWLLERADFVFLPSYLEEKEKEVRRQFCYYTQYLPALGGLTDSDGGRMLRPVLKYLYTSFHAKVQLYKLMQQIGSDCSFFDVAAAYEKAVQFKRDCDEKLKKLMPAEGSTDDIEVVLVGRPYTTLSPAMNANIPGIFRKLGINAYYQDMLSYSREEVAAIQPLLDELHWKHPVKILEATEVIAGRKNLYPVLLTSFKCTPDSFTMEYFKTLMDKHNKPYLILQLDEHDSSVGYETRIEAAVRAFRNHRRQQLPGKPLPVSYARINPDFAGSLEGKQIIFPNWDHITCSLLAATLRSEGHRVILMDETDQTIRESLKHNSGQCIPLNAIAQGYIQTIRNHNLSAGDCVLWLSESTIACNIKLYPHHIKQLMIEHGMGEAGVYIGSLSLADISLKAAMNAYFAYMLGGILRKLACKTRPYELIKGETDRILAKSIEVLTAAFEGKIGKEDAIREIVSHFGWIETKKELRPKVAVFGDFYVRDNRVMNQNLIRFLEENGAEVITTSYTEYAKMIAPAYFRKWFNEGKFMDLLTYKALLVTMKHREKAYSRLFARISGVTEHDYNDDPASILREYGVLIENTGETMDNLLKVHYIRKYYPDVSLFIQTCPALCCPSMVTEALQGKIEEKTGVPVISITYDGTGGNKNDMVLPYLKYPCSQRGNDFLKQANFS